MRAVVVHDSEDLGRSTRRMVLGSGLECRGNDFIPFEALEERLAGGDANVIVVRIGSDPVQAVELAARAVSLCQSPVFAVGPLGDESLKQQLRMAGATHMRDDAVMQTEFDTAVESMADTQSETRLRGRVISVISPTSGSGATTLAANLAGALAGWHPQGVVFAEIGRTVADVPLRLDFAAEIGTNEICRRWEQLDSTSLVAGLQQRGSGLRVLAHTGDDQAHYDAHYDDDPLQPMAVHRVGVLMRSNFPFSVWKLDSTIDEECLEALRLSDDILIVIRPDVLCVRRAQVACQLLETQGVETEQIRLIANRWGQPGQLTRRQIESALERPIFQTIPDEAKIANKALNRGSLFSEVSRAAPLTKSIVKLAKRLERENS
ncbi:MAG: hypothetical protein MPJ50_08095 [Pirellulales bacterium]|nr:hypothetical protein [Pirellulales bacterium]